MASSVVDPLGKIKSKTVQMMNPRMFSPCLLAAEDDLTNSVDVVYIKYRHIFDIVEKRFALDNLHLENGRKSLIILTGIGHNYLLESIMGKLNILLI